MALDSDKWKYRWLRIVERWENLPVRAWLNSHPQIVLGVAVGSFLLLIVVVISLLIGGPEGASTEQIKRIWYYDLNTKQLFAAKATQIPPIAAPSGPTSEGKPAGVRAYVFASEPGAEPFIAYLETLAPDADPSAYERAHANYGPYWGKGLLVRRPGDPDWIDAQSPRGRGIIERAWRPGKNGRPPQPSYP
ncbi:MAG: hypothetical protein JW828_03225 [Sedimentisphaerales bacterium]|nr:hypothetical protein [Sedimentisphaerales bacterium]